MITTANINSYDIGEGTNVTILGVTGLGSPRVQNNMFANSGRHGSQLPNSYWRERRITLDLGLRASSIANYAQLRNDLLKAFGLPRTGNSLLKFSTKDGRDFQMIVQLINSIDAPFQKGHLTIGKVRIELVSPDPYVLGQSEVETEISLAVAGGTAIPTPIPLALVSSGGVETITILGNGVNKPLITITGAVTNPTILNATTGETFTLLGEYFASDTVVIDPIAESVTLNGSINELDNMTGDFIDLRPGVNQINFSSSVYNVDAKATIKWSNSYLSI